MALKVGINGYGRIGRNILRALYEAGRNHEIQIVAVNDLADAQTNAHLTQYDTAHGKFPGKVSVEGDAIVIGSDTTVVLDGQVLNKPIDADDAVSMLRRLSGRTHTVHTGLALFGRGRGLSSRRASRATDVTFRDLSDEEIRAYVGTGSPLDKAGAYGIPDDFGAVFVSRVEGCYYTIVGLPLELLYTELRELVAAVRHA